MKINDQFAEQKRLFDEAFISQNTLAELRVTLGSLEQLSSSALRIGDAGNSLSSHLKKRDAVHEASQKVRHCLAALFDNLLLIDAEEVMEKTKSSNSKKS